jgi:uncharacterized membrane-anchored protein
VTAGIVLGCYALAWLVTARLFVAWLREGDGIDMVDAMAATACSVLWPVLAAGFIAVWLVKVLVLSENPLAFRQRRLAERDRRIREMEREAGIR